MLQPYTDLVVHHRPLIWRYQFISCLMNSIVGKFKLAVYQQICGSLQQTLHTGIPELIDTGIPYRQYQPRSLDRLQCCRGVLP